MIVARTSEADVLERIRADVLEPTTIECLMRLGLDQRCCFGDIECLSNAIKSEAL
jgi:hypothetical protein